MSNREFDDWFKGEMPNTYKGVGKEKLESFVYDTAMAAWQARVPEGYVVVPKEPTFKQIDALKNSCEILRKTGLSDLEANGAYKAMLEAVEK